MIQNWRTMTPRTPMSPISTLSEPPAQTVAHGWRNAAALFSALPLALVFLVSGLWKVLDPFSAAERMVQALVPAAFGLPAAIGVGTAETFIAILLLLPPYRRWGAWLAGLALIAFIIYIGVLYGRLSGGDCNCFPWIRRVVGPAFFITDAAMLLLATGAAIWSRPPRRLRLPGLLFASVAVFALASFGLNAALRSGAGAPDSILVEGQPRSLGSGRHFLYFFDPECSHCVAIARELGRQQWRGAEVIAVPTVNPRFARAFLDTAGLKAGISPDAGILRGAFPFTDSPYGIALSRGRQVGAYNSGELERAVFTSLRRLGFIQ
jgi:uncharacterized membrane protein YphA (DoxX/SURF4 family)